MKSTVGATQQKVRAIVWICTFKGLLLMAVISALPLILFVHLASHLQCDSRILWTSLIGVLAYTGLGSNMLWRGRQKLARNADKAMTIVGISAGWSWQYELRQALQDDLNQVRIEVGLKTPLQFILNNRIETSLATISHFWRQGTRAFVGVTPSLPRMRLTRKEVKSVFAHEAGHALLASEFWSGFIWPVAALFFQTLMAITLALGASALVFSFFSGADLNYAQLVTLMHCLTATIALALYKPAFALLIAHTGRQHEIACDDIAAVVTSPQDIASALDKSQNRASGPVKRSPALMPRLTFMDRLRVFAGRLLNSHPSLRWRIERNRLNL